MKRISILVSLALIFTTMPAAAGGSTIFLPLVFSPPANTIAKCEVFPADNIWNTPVDRAPVDSNSDRYIASMGSNLSLHADFGSGLWDGGPIGIPYVVVPGSNPLKPVSFRYAGESDPGPYPIPDNPPIEGGSTSTGDRHVLILDKEQCKLYELYDAWPPASGDTWTAGSGAIYDLKSNALRPDGWTSADAAGLSILAGLARYDEFASGAIHHALRVTAAQTRDAHIWPARHDASSITGSGVPPMGQRFRLKASFNLRVFSLPDQVFLKALQTYGLILADNGTSWYISGAPDEHWDNEMLHDLFSSLHGSDFEAVDVSGMQVSPDSGQAR